MGPKTGTELYLIVQIRHRSHPDLKERCIDIDPYTSVRQSSLIHHVPENRKPKINTFKLYIISNYSRIVTDANTSKKNIVFHYKLFHSILFSVTMHMNYFEKK